MGKKNELNDGKNALTIDPSMSTVSAATLFLCLIDLDMRHIK